MYDAVRNGRSLYNEAQRAAWVPMPRKGSVWTERLCEQDIILAQTDKDVVGFMSLAEPDYVDFAYIRPSFQGQGLFRQLFDKIEAYALSENRSQLTTHASLMAQPAFAKMGFEVVRKETVSIGNQQLERYEMKKSLIG